MSDNGLFIAIEGGEGAGKTTQAQELVNWLRWLHLVAHLTREPGSGLVGGKIRDILLDQTFEDLDPRCEALLFAADRAQHVAREVRPVMAQGAVVVTDRYADSNIAYQGAGRLMGMDEIARLSAWASGGLVPDLTVVLDIEPRHARLRREGEPDRIEAESELFHQRVRAAFLRLARANPHRYVVVDAWARSRAEISMEVRGHVAGLLIARMDRVTVLDEPMANSWKGDDEGEDGQVVPVPMTQDGMRAILEQLQLAPWEAARVPSGSRAASAWSPRIRCRAAGPAR